MLPLLDLPSALCCNRSCVSFQYAWLSFCLGFPIRFTLELINHTAYFYSWLLLPYIRYKHFRGWLFCPCIQRVSSYKLSCKSSLCHFFCSVLVLQGPCWVLVKGNFKIAVCILLFIPASHAESLKFHTQAVVVSSGWQRWMEDICLRGHTLMQPTIRETLVEMQL